MTALHALVVTVLIEVPIAAAMFPGQRARIAWVALVANTMTNVTLNVLLPCAGVHGAARILIGEACALVLEALAYARFSRPRASRERALVASAAGNLASFTLGGPLAHVLFF